MATDTKTADLNFDNLDSVSKLQNTQHFANIIQKVEEALQKGSSALNQGMEDTDYQLIADCCALGIKVEDEIVILHYFICEKYRVKFPELASLVLDPMIYARVVMKIGNVMDLTLVDLEGLLCPAVVSTVSVAASTTSGNPLLEENLKMTIAACDRLLALDLARKKVLEFLKGRVEYVAPNVSALVGHAVAANLIWTAGGVSQLARLPVNFLFLCPKREYLATSETTLHACGGLLDQTDMLESTPNLMKMTVREKLGVKSILAARLDSKKEDLGRLEEPLRKRSVRRLRSEDGIQSLYSKGVQDSDMAKSKRMRVGQRFSIRDVEALVSKIKIPQYSEEYLDRKAREARQAFDADEAMSALNVIFRRPRAHGLDRVHPHVYSRWMTRKYVIPVD